MKLSRVSAVNWNKIQTIKTGGVEPPDQQLLAAGKGSASNDIPARKR